jgi:hypothetical protein
MAKVIVIFEDVEEGVSVKVTSEPAFPEPSSEEITEAQQLGIRMTQLLTEEVDRQNAVEQLPSFKRKLKNI